MGAPATAGPVRRLECTRQLYYGLAGDVGWLLPTGKNTPAMKTDLAPDFTRWKRVGKARLCDKAAALGSRSITYRSHVPRSPPLLEAVLELRSLWGG